MVNHAKYAYDLFASHADAGRAWVERYLLDATGPATASGECITEGGSYLASLSGLGTLTNPVYAGVSSRTGDVGFHRVKGDVSH